MSGAERDFKNATEIRGKALIKEISDSIIKDVQSIGGQGHKNISEAIKKEMKKIYVAKNEDGLDRHPKHYLDFVYVDYWLSSENIRL